MQLEKKRIIVAGGARGIGEYTVYALAREGAAVVSLDINDKAGVAVAKKAAKLGPGPIIYMHCDIGKQNEVTRVFKEAASKLGGLDVMFVIAGKEQRTPAEEVTEKDIDDLITVNIKGTMFADVAAFRLMQESGGAIINYGSYAGARGAVGMPVYSATKGAVMAYTRTVALEWAKNKIRVNSVCPLIRTPMMDEWLDSMTPDERAMIEAGIAMIVPLGGKPGKPEDAADLNVFLASDASRFITGQTISVDGGMMMVGS